MLSFTPLLQLETLFVLDEAGRILSTREPHASPGPAFSLIRDAKSCAWGVNSRVASELADHLNALAREEPPLSAHFEAPRHAASYVRLLGGKVGSGPVFTFPTTLPASAGVVEVTALSMLQAHFRGWTAEELPERSPIIASVIDGQAVSVCFCARRSHVAAEAGVETAAAFRGRGLGPNVTAAWARMIRESGRLPLYSTSWKNGPSRALAKTLRLFACGVDWSVYAALG